MDILIVSKTDECRSRLAEALLSSYGRGMRITTAGVMEGNVVSEIVCDVAGEGGYTLSRQHPIAVEQFKQRDWDYVVTLCREAEMEIEQLKIETKETAHFDFPSLSSSVGASEEDRVITLLEQMDQQLYRFYRDELRDKLMPTCTCGANTYCRCE